MSNVELKNVRIQIKSDLAVSWTNNNPILLKAEIGFETDTNKLKIGNGSSTWNQLNYISAQTVIKTLNNPNSNDSGYDVGSIWINTFMKDVYILIDNTHNNAIWKKLITPDDLSALGAGDMLKSQFANNPKEPQGYVNAAIVADGISSTGSVSYTQITGLASALGAISSSSLQDGETILHSTDNFILNGGNSDFNEL